MSRWGRRRPNRALGVIIGVVLAGWGGLGWIEASRSTSWPSTYGTITSVRQHSSGGSGGQRYRVHVEYQYAVDGQVYTSSRMRIPDISFFRGDRVNDPSAYREGNTVRVYYNPSDPAAAVLEPGVGWSVYSVVGVGGLVTATSFLGIGARRRSY